MFYEIFFTIVFIIGFPICISERVYETYVKLYNLIGK